MLCSRDDFSLGYTDGRFVLTERVNGVGDIVSKFSDLDSALESYINFTLLSRVKCLAPSDIDELDLNILVLSLVNKYKEFEDFLESSALPNVGYRFRLRVTPCINGGIFTFRLVGGKRDYKFYMAGEWFTRVPKGAVPIREFFNKVVVIKTSFSAFKRNLLKREQDSISDVG